MKCLSGSAPPLLYRRSRHSRLSEIILSTIRWGKYYKSQLLFTPSLPFPKSDSNNLIMEQFWKSNIGLLYSSTHTADKLDHHNIISAFNLLQWFSKHSTHCTTLDTTLDTILDTFLLDLAQLSANLQFNEILVVVATSWQGRTIRP